MDIFTLIGRIVLEGGKEVKSELEGIEGAIESHKGQLKILGAAFTAVGAAGLAMVQMQKELKISLNQTGITLGLSNKQMRDLAMSMTNVGLPLKELAATLDVLTRSGLRDVDQIKQVTNAFDALSHATGTSTDAVANILIPAFKALGEEIPTTSEELDKFTWLTKNSTITLEDFGSVMNYVAIFGQKLNVTSEDMVKILAALEDKGIKGSRATRMFRTAINEANTSGKGLNEVLGLSQDELDAVGKKLQGVTGITERYAKEAEKQYTLMDKIKQKVSELTFQFSAFLEPLQPILVALTAMGPLLIFLGSAAGVATVKFIALTVSMTACQISLVVTQGLTYGLVAALQVLWAAMLTNPIGWIVILVGGLIAVGVALIANWEKVVSFFKWAWNDIAASFGFGSRRVKEAVDEVSNAIVEASNKTRALVETVQDHYDRMTRTMEKYTAKAIASAQKVADASIAALEAQKTANQKAHDLRMDQLEKEYIAQIKLVDEALAKTLEAGKSKIDAIDAELEAKRRAEKAKADAEIIASLKSQIASETDAEQKKALERELADTLTQQAYEGWQQRLEDEKTSIQASMEAAQDAAEKRKEQLQADYDAAKLNEDAKLTALNLSLTNQQAAIQAGVDAQKLIYEQDLENFKSIAEDKESIAASNVNMIVTEYNRLAAVLGVPAYEVVPVIPTAPVTRRSWRSATGTGTPPYSQYGWTLRGDTWYENLPPVKQMAQGGIIPEPTLLYGLRSQRAYAMAGETGTEYVTPKGGGSVTIEMTDFNGRLLARAVAPHLVDLIRLRTGIKV